MCDNVSLKHYVPQIQNSVQDKRHYEAVCCCCPSQQRKSPKVPEVAKALFHQQIQLAILRNRGNFAHNAEVVRKGTEHLVARYRTEEIRHSKDFIDCILSRALLKNDIVDKKLREDATRLG